MTALNKDRNTPRREGKITAYGMAANAKIFNGSLVCINTAGYAVPAADTAGFRFAGIARQYVDNTGGANGALTVEVEESVVKLVAAGMAITDVTKPVFVADDQTVALTSTNGVCCGVIVEFESATAIWVDTSRANARSALSQDAVASANGAEAAGANPTKAEYDVVVALANELKAVVNGLITKLKTGRLMG